MDDTATVLPDLPSLDPFLTSLAQLVTSTTAPPESIFIHTPSNPDLLPSLLPLFLSHLLPSPPVLPPASTSNSPSPPSVQDLLPTYVVLDLHLLLNPKAVFDAALNGLSGWEQYGGMQWRPRTRGVVNWDGRTKGISVVEARKDGKRKAPAGAKGKGKKRARVQEAFGDDDVVQESEQEEEEGNQEEASQPPIYTLKWLPSAPLPPRDPLAPLKDTLDAFHSNLRTIFSLSSSPSTSSSIRTQDPSKQKRRFLIFTHGEMLHEVAGGTGGGGAGLGGAPKETGLGMTFASTIYRLQQLAGVPITPIVISSLSWIKAREGMVGLAEPTVLTQPELSPSDVTTLLTHRFTTSFPTLDPDVFRSLSTTVHSTFSSTVSTSLSQLARLCATLHPTCSAIVEDRQLSATNLALLHQHWKEPLQRLLLTSSAVTSSHAPLTAFVSSTSPSKLSSLSLPPSSPTKEPKSELNLPALAKFLLIAAFLAGTNAPKTDVRCFVRVDEGAAKKGKRVRKIVASKPGSPTKFKVRADLTAGKAFPLERLLAIFEAILTPFYEYLSGSPAILTQIASLVRLRLLSRQSGTDKLLDGVKLRCKLPRAAIDGLAKSVGMGDWSNFLADAGE